MSLAFDYEVTRCTATHKKQMANIGIVSKHVFYR